MLIGVVSDTHRHTWIMERVMEKLKGVDLLIHLGDNIQDVKEFKKVFKKRIINVKGNCDYSSSIPSDIFEEIEGQNFFITHGHHYDVKHSLSRLKYKALELNADIVLFGHTHVSQIIYEEGIWFINPGSPVLSRDGFNSVALINIDNNKINASIKAIR
ncbi:metallophosphoesterase family protein [Clostridium rectalis]|uniref:metallophosphoesterase family protein n=1 Tax=Clostridium rectalis TaxID=2040295 RepID=UPI000F63B18F|nr:metallophosphoesterase [Clostridium rectalis]